MLLRPGSAISRVAPIFRFMGLLVKRTRCALVTTAALVCCASPTASAAPSGLSLSVVPAAGGPVRILVRARHASSCRLIEVPGSERPFNCASGSIVRRLAWPANTSTTRRCGAPSSKRADPAGERRRKAIEIEELAPKLTGRLSKRDPAWERITELHAQRFGRTS